MKHTPAQREAIRNLQSLAKRERFNLTPKEADTILELLQSTVSAGLEAVKRLEGLHIMAPLDPSFVEAMQLLNEVLTGPIQGNLKEKLELAAAHVRTLHSKLQTAQTFRTEALAAVKEGTS